MINTITINNIASYKEEVNVEDLQKVNFFFGNNGSGKSTVAKLLHSKCDIEDLLDTDFKDCIVEGYNKESHQILVYDDKFVERNFINSSTQPGIFSLNEANNEIDTLIENQQNKLKGDEEYLSNTLPERVKKVNDLLEEEFKTLKRKCFDERKSFDTFYKHTIKYSGSSQRHFETVEQVLKNQPIPLITIEYLSDQYNKIYEQELQKVDTNIPTIAYRLIRKKEMELDNLMQEVIVGNTEVDIAQMIQDFSSKKWVEEGLQYLNEDLPKQKCPFCQEETITEELMGKFTKYFDETYKGKINKITELKTEYIKLTDRYLELFKQLEIEFNPDDIVSSLYTELKSLFDSNIKNIDDKILNSNEKKELDSLFQYKQNIVDVNERILQHNKEFENIDKTREQFDKDIWNYFALKCKERIELYYCLKTRLENILQSIDELKEPTNNRIADSKEKIEKWRDDTVTTVETVERINEILRNCGFSGFSIEIKEEVNKITRYFLKRDSDSDMDVFRTLSEGEKNFIAFLYFHQLCLGTDNVEEGEKKKIIVIDDPVSSLDSQVLFVVNTLIHQLIARKGSERPNKQTFFNQYIDQVFIMTHNIFFFKEITVDNNRGCTKREFYLVSKTNGKTSIEQKKEKEIGTSDYNLMWSSLKSIKTSIEKTNKEYNVLIGNLMRRIIESYVNFIGIGESVWGVIKDIKPEDTRNIICSSLICEIHDASHKVSPLDDIYFTRITNETPSSLFEVFKLIFEEIGKEHYVLMMEEGYE